MGRPCVFLGSTRELTEHKINPDRLSLGSMVGNISLVNTFKMKLGTDDFNGGFLKWGVPSNHHKLSIFIYFNELFQHKPTILGSCIYGNPPVGMFSIQSMRTWAPRAPCHVTCTVFVSPARRVFQNPIPTTATQDVHRNWGIYSVSTL